MEFVETETGGFTSKGENFVSWSPQDPYAIIMDGTFSVEDLAAIADRLSQD